MKASEAISMLESTCHSGDYEADHTNADDILARFVRELGYPEVADAYECVGPKYTA